MPVAMMVIIAGWLLARGGMKAVFGTHRDQPEVIATGAFRIVRHPIYLGAILFYLGAIISTMSLASALFWIAIIDFYIWISRYEEKRCLADLVFSDYPLNAYLNRLVTVGFCPCIRMAVRKIRAPTQTVNKVKRITPSSPTIGCQTGMVTGVARRIIMMEGVNGGISDSVVASGPPGS